ncbi:hypothetical protein NT239_07860 [Chitinibacter sp. SCUT-21]|uniref:substrate-binding periplasmic protein n=1 Tax=Chitinibacter sp. SCUT-21 TaxID=2970891 RepID=UPI0035A690E2
MQTLVNLGKLLCILFFASLTGLASAKETIILTGGEKFIQSPYGKWLELVYKEAFRRLDYELQVVGYPSQRAIFMADKGEVDGQIERGYDFNIEHPNLVRVEEPTNQDAYSAFTLKSGISLKGWDSLRGSKYTVVARRGVGRTVATLGAIVGNERLYFVENPEKALLMLQAGHADLYIDYDPLVEDTLASLRKSDPSAFAGLHKAGEMDFTTHHAFLHQRWAALAPKLAHVLKEMKREGLFEKYRKMIPGL